MKLKALAVASVLALAAPAQALDLAAGWDFSQTTNPPELVVGGALVDTLGANYSDLVDDGLGPASAAFGTAYFNGDFGSYASPTTPPPGVLKSANGNIDANTNMAQEEMGSQGAYNVLLNKGQASAGDRRLQADGPDTQDADDLLDVVFGVDLSSVNGTGSNWQVSFAGQTLSSNSNLVVEFSDDGGSNFSEIQTVLLTTAAQQFIVDLGGADLAEALVRLRFIGDAVIGPAVDNVAIKADIVVPEPGTILLLASGLGGLALIGRRRV